MQELERQFPETPLIPGSQEHRAEVEDVCRHASGAVTTVHRSCLHIKRPSWLRAFGMVTIVSNTPQLACRSQAVVAGSTPVSVNKHIVVHVEAFRGLQAICAFNM